MLAETKTWLDELAKNGELTADQRTAIETALEGSPKAQEFVKGSALRQSDYSRQMNELKAEKDRIAADIATKEAKLNEEFTRMSAYGEDANSKIKAAQEAVEKAIAKEARFKARVQGWVANGEVSADDAKGLFDDSAPTPPGTPPPAKPNDPDPRYLTRDEFNELGGRYAELPFEVAQTGYEIQQLTGKPPDMRALYKQAVKEKKPIAQVAEEIYKLSNIRKANERAEIEKEVRVKLDEEYKTRMSEMALGRPNTPETRGSPAFDLNRQKADAPPIPQNAPAAVKSSANKHATVQRAVASYLEGKHRTQANQ